MTHDGENRRIEVRKIGVEEPAFIDVLKLRWEQLDMADDIPLPTEPSNNDKYPHAIHVAAFDDARVVGTVRIDPGIDADGLVRRMAVAPDMRRRKIGTQVLMLAEHFAVDEMDMMTLHLNAKIDAVEFYKSWGYHLTGKQYRWPSNEDGERHFEMMKVLIDTNQ
jgi:predicted GNAT family N-acyltransferase